MKDRISALMDGELEDRPAAELIGALGREREALETWRTYHLIGDAMRDSTLLSEGFSARFSEKLAAEPVVIAPGRLKPVEAPAHAWYGWSAAASVAAVALVGWVALAPQQTGAPLQVPVAQAPLPAVAVSAPLVDKAPAPLRAQAPQTVPFPSSAANDYLLAHQGFSPRMSIGMAPYVRTVADRSQESRR